MPWTYPVCVAQTACDACGGVTKVRAMCECRRLPGCPDAASKLLQAAMHSESLPTSYASGGAPPEDMDGDSQDEDAMLSPTPQVQQVWDGSSAYTTHSDTMTHQQAVGCA